MDDLILVRPSAGGKTKIWEYRQEYFDRGETHINGSGGIAGFDAFEPWLETVLSMERDRRATTFFSVRKDDGSVIGSIQLRHNLTQELARHGGHIGYSIRPAQRGKGYGKQQLGLVLDAAREMGIPRVMITCDKENIASARTAIGCGGVLTEENLYHEKMQQIYWINLAK